MTASIGDTRRLIDQEMTAITQLPHLTQLSTDADPISPTLQAPPDSSLLNFGAGVDLKVADIRANGPGSLAASVNNSKLRSFWIH